MRNVFAWVSENRLICTLILAGLGMAWLFSSILAFRDGLVGG